MKAPGAAVILLLAPATGMFAWGVLLSALFYWLLAGVAGTARVVAAG